MSKSNWEQMEFSVAMRPFVEEVIKRVLKEYDHEIKEFHWVEKNEAKEVNILDQKIGIDLITYLSQGQSLYWQVKNRDAKKYPQYTNQFTMEHYNNPATKELGEFFRLGADLYFYGWGHPEIGFVNWAIIDIPQLKLYWPRLKKEHRTNRRYSKADFYAINFSDMRKCLFYRKDWLKDTVQSELDDIFQKRKVEVESSG